MIVNALSNTQITAPATTGLENAVGNTPLLPLRRIASGISPQVQIYAKAEWFNPGGSVKDRPALNIIRTALESGQLADGKSLLDATSGNMGISYATLGAALGVPVTLAISSKVSPERLVILRALGVDLILTDPGEGTDGAIRTVQEMVNEEPDRYYFANQFDNPANWQAHYMATGPEVWEQTSGQVTHFVAGLGTSGTLMGTARFLREQTSEVEIIALQPDGPVNGLEGLKHMETAIVPAIYDPKMHDRTLNVSTEDAYDMVRRLAREEGLFVGVSSGAAAVAALRLAAELESGVVVTVFPDAGYKYMSGDFWGRDV